MSRWEIRQLDCGKPLPDLAPSAADGLYLQLWEGSVPLGHLWVSRGVLPVDRGELSRLVADRVAAAVGYRLITNGFRASLPTVAANPARDVPPKLEPLAEAESPLARLRDQHALPTISARISVIICTRDRPELLRKCLASITLLDPAPYELIVVDNSPAADSTRDVVQDFPSAIYVHEPQGGLSRARNAGLRCATGNVIAWTDDDVTVPTRWLEAIESAFSDPDIAAITGLVLPAELETAAQFDFEYNRGGFNRGYRPLLYDKRFFDEMSSRGVPAWMVGAGANMAFRREVFDKVGVFDERLGAGAAGCSEDSELWYRMLAEGLPIAYDPTVFVWHTHRVEDGAFDHQMKQYMCGHVTALLVQYEKFRHAGNLRRLFLTLPNYYWRLCAGNLSHLNWRTPWAEIRGCLQGVWYYLKSRRESSGQ